MLLETVETVAGWLSDPVSGVNAIRSTLPRYASDDVPPAVSVVSAFRDDEAARGDAKLTSLPALEVGLWQDPATETSPAVRPFPADGEVTVCVRYIPAKTTATATAARHAAQTLRVVQRVLATRSIGQTVVNDVQIMSAQNIRVLAMYTPSGDTVVTGALVVSFRVRDTWTHPQ